jgi:hypothetical protein
VTSNVVNFVIEPPEILAAEAMVDLDGRNTGFLRVEFLARTPSGPRLYQAFFSEPRTEAHGLTTSDFKEAVKAPAEAERVLAPWTNFTRSEAYFARFGWESKNAIGVEEDPREKSSARFPSDGMRWARPALMVREGDVDVFGWKDRRIVVARLAREGKPAELVASGELAATPVACRATLGPESLGSRRVAVAVSANAQGMDLTLVVMSQGKLLMKAEHVEALLPLRGSEPDVAVAADGTIRAAVIAVDAADRTQAVLVELVQTPEGVRTRSGALGPFAGEARAAAVVYRPLATEGGPRWAVLLNDGRMIDNVSSGRPRALSGAPFVPLQLIARSGQTYVVVRDAVKGLTLDHLFPLP